MFRTNVTSFFGKTKSEIPIPPSAETIAVPNRPNRRPLSADEARPFTTTARSPHSRTPTLRKSASAIVPGQSPSAVRATASVRYNPHTIHRRNSGQKAIENIRRNISPPRKNFPTFVRPLSDNVRTKKTPNHAQIPPHPTASMPLCDGNGNRSDRHRPHRRRAAATRRRGSGRHADARLGLCRRRGERPRRAVRHRIRRPSLPTAVPASQLRPADGGAFGRRRRHRYADRSDEPRGRSGRPGRTPAGESRAGAPELRPPSRRTGQNRRQRLRSPHQTARRERTRRGAHARRRRRCDGHPQRKTLDDDGRTARRTAQIDPGRAGGEGRGALRRTAAVPHPRRGDQRRASPPFRPLVLRPGQRHLRGRLLPLVGNGSERRLFDADTLGRRALPRRRSPFDAQTAADLAAHGRQRHVRHPAGAAPCRRQPHAQPPHGAFVENLRKKPYRPGLHRIVHPVGQRRHLGHGQLRRKRLAYPRRRGDAQPRALRLHGFRNADRGRLHALQHHQPAGDVAPAGRRRTFVVPHRRRTVHRPPLALARPEPRPRPAVDASSMSATTTTSIIRRKRR